MRTTRPGVPLLRQPSIRFSSTAEVLSAFAILRLSDANSAAFRSPMLEVNIYSGLTLSKVRSHFASTSNKVFPLLE